MTKESEYLILTFKTTADVMQAEQYLKDIFSIAIIPVPREISSGCGLAIRFLHPDETAIRNFLKASPLDFELYKMKTERLGKARSVEKIIVS